MPVLAPHGNHRKMRQMGDFQRTKMFLIDHTGLATDALHIYVALILFIGSCLLFGWKAWQWKPWLLVLMAAIAGEVWDIRNIIPENDPVRPWSNWQDIWNTMLLPTALLLCSRFTKIFAGTPPKPSGDQP
jgi:hypothetical protein